MSRVWRDDEAAGVFFNKGAPSKTLELGWTSHVLRGVGRNYCSIIRTCGMSETLNDRGRTAGVGVPRRVPQGRPLITLTLLLIVVAKLDV